MKRGLLVLFIGLVAVFVCSNIYSQTTYTWNIGTGGSWATPANWTPARNTPAANDILVFNNGGTKAITNVTTQTIGRLTISGNSNIVLSSTGAARVLTISNATTALDVQSGSTLTLTGDNGGGGTRTLTLGFSGAGNTVTIAGILNISDLGSPSTFITTNSITLVTGTLRNNGGTITSAAGNLSIASAGTYTHSLDGNTIPTATWNSASNCNITGITTSAPGGLSQAFGNFIWDCAGHNNLIELNSTLTTINGDFTVRSAGQANAGNGRTQNGLALATNTNLTLNVGGNLTVEHNSSSATWLIMAYGTANVTLNVTGNFNMSLAGSGTCFFDYKINTGTSMGTLVVNVGGNLTMTGGYLDMAYQASGYTVGTELRLSGNLSVSAASAFISSGGNLVNGKIIFSKAGTQTIYEGAAGRIAYTNFQVNSGSTTEFLSNIYLYDYVTAIKSGNFTVLSGGILDMNTYILHGYNVASGQLNVVNTYTSFTLNSGAGFITANANGVHRIGFTNGSISAAIATRTFSSGANYTYDGVLLQNSGTFVTTPVANQVNNLTINNITGINTTGVTLEQEIKVASTCTFISGVFTTTDVNVLTINDDAVIVGADLSVGSNKYVNGPLKKIGNDAFTFPVGKASHGCRPVYISAPANTTDQFRAELIRGNAGLLGPVTAAGLARVSGCEYWYIDRLVGSSNVDLTLSWNGESPCNAQSYVTDIPNLVVAHFNNTSWDTYGKNGSSGNAVSGTVTWNYTGPYNVTPIHTPWSLGSLVWYENPLTVKFVNLRASEKDGQVKVEWANIAEAGVEKYFVEYSIDGRSFDEINNATARKNDGKRTDYSWWHITPTSGANYYRIKAIEFAGAVTYSQIVRLDLNKSNSDLIVYPNPVKGNNVSIAASGLAAGKYDIIVLNMSGQKIVQRSLDHAGGSISMQVDLPETIKAGLYSIRLSGSEKTVVKTFIVQ